MPGYTLIEISSSYFQTHHCHTATALQRLPWTRIMMPREVWHKMGRCGKGSSVAQEKSMVLLKRWWTSGNRGDYFGSWGSWPQTWRSRWATFWLMTCHVILKIWIAGHVWWGGRGWTIPVVVGSHGSWNWEAGGGIWGHGSLWILENLRVVRFDPTKLQLTFQQKSILRIHSFWSNGWGPAIWWVWCYVDFRWSWWGHLAVLMLLSNHCQKSPKS